MTGPISWGNSNRYFLLQYCGICQVIRDGPLENLGEAGEVQKK